MLPNTLISHHSQMNHLFLVSELSSHMCDHYIELMRVSAVRSPLRLFTTPLCLHTKRLHFLPPHSQSMLINTHLMRKNDFFSVRFPVNEERLFN